MQLLDSIFVKGNCSLFLKSVMTSGINTATKFSLLLYDNLYQRMQFCYIRLQRGSGMVLCFDL